MKLKSTFKLALALLALLTLNSQLSTAFAQGSVFTYQGQLQNNGSPANGSYTIIFNLYTNETGGNSLGAVTNNNVAVSNGLFTTVLNGNLLTGDFTNPPAPWPLPSWLELEVATNGANAFTSLTPRQQLTPVPVATYAETAGLSGAYGSPVAFNNASNSFSGTFSGDGTPLLFGGYGYCDLPCYWRVTGNPSTTPGPDFVGTTDNKNLELHVYNQRALQIIPVASQGSDSPDLVGGAAVNSISAGIFGAVIAGGGTTNFSGEYSPNQISSVFGSIGGGSGNTIQSGADHSVIAGGWNNLISSTSWEGVIAGGEGNSLGVHAQWSAIGGGYVNTNLALFSVISGGNLNFISTNGNYSFIGGGYSNLVGDSTGSNSNLIGATIAGGYQNTIRPNNPGAFIGGGLNNRINDGSTDCVISGGQLNYASFALSTVGGGYQNTASADSATVSGGAQNLATAGGAAVGGGSLNAILGNPENVTCSTIGGGYGNTNSGYFATVPGGFSNLASGQFSFAAGQQAQAKNQGAFVWADSQNAPFASTANDQFLIRAQGYVGINTAGPSAPLHVVGSRTGDSSKPIVKIENLDTTSSSSSALRVIAHGGPSQGALSVSTGWTNAPNSTNVLIAQFGNQNAYVSQLDNIGNWTGLSFNPTSDRNAKENFQPISPREVLAKVAALPISRWNFKQDTGRPHMGPMAQDFHAAFQLGMDDKHIATVDEEGVALAAIQGLNQALEEQVKVKDAAIQDLQQRMDRLEKLLSNPSRHH